MNIRMMPPDQQLEQPASETRQAPPAQGNSGPSMENPTVFERKIGRWIDILKYVAVAIAAS
ncbi:hypothetical protein [Mesorhizobium silamurunense]|uniref:hypothetical protein n=1 Tax=Mesorhizobium silamurunense TaxID=499528 RepID=UPI00177ECCAE|nr:hypothetical protein [Mesorhizobium silamurunense]